MLKLFFLAAEGEEAQAALKALQAAYPSVTDPREADYIIVLGGDGFMLRAIREQISHEISDATICGATIMDKPIYGMNRGTVGFLLNQFSVENLCVRLEAAQAFKLTPLLMQVEDIEGKHYQAHAFNEVSLFRQTRQAANLDIYIDGVMRLNGLVCDGVLVATPAGSTAYNLSAHGPILPLGSKLLAMTPISAFRPRRWHGAILPSHAKITLEVNHTQKRPVSATADIIEFRNVKRVSIAEDSSWQVKLLYDPEHNLEERILREQFQA